MSDETKKTPPVEDDGDVEPRLGDLAEVLAERLGAGQPIDIEDYAGKYPALTESIRQLVPTIHDLVTAGRSMRHAAKDDRLSPHRQVAPDGRPDQQQMSPDGVNDSAN